MATDVPGILIVDDNEDNRYTLQLMLESDGHERIAAALRRHSLRALENEYVGKIENEKRHSENLLRNILPAEIATRLRNGESNIADHFDDATVIFADVVGFGKITARMKAYEIVACLNQLFSKFDGLAEDAGVEKIKKIGRASCRERV